VTRFAISDNVDLPRASQACVALVAWVIYLGYLT